MKTFPFFWGFCRMIWDAGLIWLAFLISYWIRIHYFDWFFLSSPHVLLPFESFFEFSAVFSIVLVGIMALYGRYQEYDEPLGENLWHLFWGFCGGLAVVLVFFYFVQIVFFSRFILGFGSILALVFLIIGSVVERQMRLWLNRFGWGTVRIIIVIGKEIKHYKNFLSFFKNHPHYQLAGIFADGQSGENFLNPERLEEIIADGTLDEIFIYQKKENDPFLIKIINEAQIKGATVHLLPDITQLDMALVKPQTFNGMPMVTLLNSRIRGWGGVLKNFADFVFSTLALVFLSPLFLVISLLIFHENSQAPIFYRSRRVGQNGVLFDCIKFRTMRIDADKMKKKLKNERTGGIFFKVKNDPRITKIGKFLRKTSLDELPQLWNVFLGEMSLIGPRPHLPEEVKKYPKKNRELLSIKPGITGFSQVNGRSDLDFETEMRYETFYMKQWSPWLDMLIFIKTIGIIIRGKNW